MTKHTDLKGKRRHADPDERKKLRVVGVRHVPTPDAEARLCRAIGILLKAAARGTTKSEDSIRGKKGPAGGSLTSGNEGEKGEPL